MTKQVAPKMSILLEYSTPNPATEITNQPPTQNGVVSTQIKHLPPITTPNKRGRGYRPTKIDYGFNGIDVILTWKDSTDHTDHKGTTQYVANRKNVDAVSKPRREYQTNHVIHIALKDQQAGTEQVNVIITMTMMM